MLQCLKPSDRKIKANKTHKNRAKQKNEDEREEKQQNYV